jgi:hypothetical protein
LSCVVIFSVSVFVLFTVVLIASSCCTHM